MGHEPVRKTAGRNLLQDLHVIGERALEVRPAPLGRDSAPVLLAVVDTEEDRGWGSYRRDDVCVESMRHADRAQRIFEAYKICATWVADYPVVSQKEGYQPLREFSESGVATIGAHCHPAAHTSFDAKARTS